MNFASKNPVPRNGARLEQKSGRYFFFAARPLLTPKALSMTSNRNRAVAAAMGAVQQQGLTVDDAIVLQGSNKLAVRLLPCDVLSRVAEERIGAPGGVRSRACLTARGNREPRSSA